MLLTGRGAIIRVMDDNRNDTRKAGRPARIILFTGKGGVGKTSVAAATAVRAAEMGLGALIMSTDAAHSLSDSFDLPVGHDPVQVRPNLWAQEMDVNRQMSEHWGPIQAFLRRFMTKHGLDSVIAEEMAVLPGMEEIFSLLAVREHAADERFDLLVIDCAPTADTARLLTLPEITRWYMEKVFRIQRTVVGAVRPMAERLLDTPLPTDDVFENIKSLHGHIMDVKDMLTDRKRTSIRLVLNPEKMVIKEAQRAFTFLSLFDFNLDAVVVNRVLPEQITDPYYGKWRELQAEHLAFIRTAFQPLPILTARLWDREIVGLELLSRLAGEVYGDRSPADVFQTSRPVSVCRENGLYLLDIPVPFADREELQTWVHGDELTVKYKNFKRNLLLPRVLAQQKLQKAEFRDRHLRLYFGGDSNDGKS